MLVDGWRKVFSRAFRNRFSTHPSATHRPSTHGLSIHPSHPYRSPPAPQNPPGTYGGRKVLSRAFRNRFLEMEMDEIPHAELVTILEKRSALPGSFCKVIFALTGYTAYDTLRMQ